jgi:hypothetical protein
MHVKHPAWMTVIAATTIGAPPRTSLDSLLLVRMDVKRPPSMADIVATTIGAQSSS